MKTPILFLVFNRPLLTIKVFEQIRKYRPNELFVAIDGPRKTRPDDIENIMNVKKIIDSVDWDCKIYFLIRDENLGCGKAISSAIDWFFSNVEEGIILEDDCVPSLDFFEFMEAMLVKYRFNDYVMAINGSNPLGKTNLNETYFYSKYNFVWGWATWRNSWLKYSYNLNNESKLSVLLNLCSSFKFDIVSIRSWYKHLMLVARGEIDTWDYQWMYTCWKHNGIIITPSMNLVRNIGNEGEPTHGIVSSDYINLEHHSLNLPYISPKSFKINHNIDKLIKRYRFGNYIFYFLKNKLYKMNILSK